MQRIPMTVEGAEALREELQRLKTEVRPRIVKAIAEAREHGDLKENAEYHAAREEQSSCEGHNNRIEGKLGCAPINDVKAIANIRKVIYGTTVTIGEIETDKEDSYQIVGEDEANIRAGKISVTSPIARGLVGKEVGDEVQINTL